MSYNRVNWIDYPDKATPINATNLNIMDKGISDLWTSNTKDVTVQYGSARSTISFTKVGRIVCSSQFSIQAEITTSSWQEIGLLPNGFTPMYNFSTYAENIVSGINPPQIRLSTDGKIYIAKYSSSGLQDWYFQIPIYISNK